MQVSQKPRSEPLQARTIGFALSATTRSAPRWLCQGPGPERFLYVRVPALSTTRPLVLGCLLTNELLINLSRRQRTCGRRPYTRSQLLDFREYVFSGKESWLLPEDLRFRPVR